MTSENRPSIQFYIHPKKAETLKEIGSENMDDSSKLIPPLATITQDILELLIELHRSPEMKVLKAKEGGDTLDILRRAFLSYSWHLLKEIPRDIDRDEFLHRYGRNILN